MPADLKDGGPPYLLVLRVPAQVMVPMLSHRNFDRA